MRAKRNFIQVIIPISTPASSAPIITATVVINASCSLQQHWWQDCLPKGTPAWSLCISLPVILVGERRTPVFPRWTNFSGHQVTETGHFQNLKIFQPYEAAHHISVPAGWKTPNCRQTVLAWMRAEGSTPGRHPMLTGEGSASVIHTHYSRPRELCHILRRASKTATRPSSIYGNAEV